MASLSNNENLNPNKNITEATRFIYLPSQKKGSVNSLELTISNFIAYAIIWKSNFPLVTTRGVMHYLTVKACIMSVLFNKSKK